jgi:dTDP-4-amino-4,6-dideoxygalactose transaminase
MKYVQEAFDQNWVAPLGKNVDEFEVAMKNFLLKINLLRHLVPEQQHYIWH